MIYTEGEVTKEVQHMLTVSFEGIADKIEGNGNLAWHLADGIKKVLLMDVNNDGGVFFIVRDESEAIAHEKDFTNLKDAVKFYSSIGAGNA
jgi:hypothetical protein